MHLKATDAPTYVSLSLVEDGGIIVVGSDSGARGDVHHGRRCAAATADDAAANDTADGDGDGDGDTEDILC